MSTPVEKRAAIRRALEELSEFKSAGTTESPADEAFLFREALTRQGWDVKRLEETFGVDFQGPIPVEITNRQDEAFANRLRAAALVGRAAGLLGGGDVDRDHVVAAVSFLGEALDLIAPVPKRRP